MSSQNTRDFAPSIVQDFTINSGRPIIEGTRVFVDRIVGHLESGMSIEEICQEYDLTHKQIDAVRRLTSGQIQYIKGYADALEHRVYEVA